jgi:hypothetical protein
MRTNQFVGMVENPNVGGVGSCNPTFIERAGLEVRKKDFLKVFLRRCNAIKR